MTSSLSDEIGRVLDYAESGRALAEPVPPVHVEPATDESHRTKVWGTIAVAGVIIIAYALLQNSYWVHGGDSEVYLCLARNVALGKGFVFNGQPVAMVPPGWPLLLAGAMKVTSSFLLLKLIPMLAMAGGMILFYLALRDRVAPAPTAAVAVIVVALLVPIYTLTSWFHAEGGFMFCAAGALLLAGQISEGKQQWWRIALLALLCGLSLTTRLAGMAFFPVIAGMVLRGQLLPRPNRVWIAAVLAGAVMFGTFICLRHAQRVRPEALDPRFDASLSGSYEIVNTADKQDDTYASRLYDAPMWIAGLLWQPVVTAPIAGLRDTARVVGWIVLGLFLIKLTGSIRRREWVWFGVAVYAGYLIINWPSPVARYFIPVAPFLLIATLDSMTWLTSWIKRSDWRDGWALGLRSGFVGLVLLPNLGSYFYDVWVMRSPHFYQRYMGGTLETLIEATNWLRPHGLHDGDLAVSRRYATPETERYTNGWMRAACTLTNVAVMTVPDKLSHEPDPELKAWLVQNHVRYYLYLPRIYVYGSVKRLSWQGIPIRPQDTEWRLYEVVDGDVRRVPLSRTARVAAPTKAAATMPTTETVEVRVPVANAEFRPVRRVPGL